MSSMITTVDNPYDPFTQFDEWEAYDEGQGYHTTSYLARIANTSDELSQEDEDLAIDKAVDEIAKMNITGLYKKVTKKLDSGS